MYTFIFDIGKTNIKGHVLNDAGIAVWSQSCVNEVDTHGPYPHFDVEQIWGWLRNTLREAAGKFDISAINVSTHGACAVFLDEQGKTVLPVMDYEFVGLRVEGEDYDRIRPPFNETLSPNLGAGLNLGRQLWWMKHQFPEQFAAAHRILMYPQYWVYKLTGIAVMELTSLGCHTDLWEPQKRRYSNLVKVLGIEEKLPPLADATTCVGTVTAPLALELGLSGDCRVYAGVHDSNASFARYLAAGFSESFTVMSTGTWVVAMCSEGDMASLSEARDMLANVSVAGRPIACARFMGGREFELLCRMTGATPSDPLSCAEIQDVVLAGVFARPPFVKGSGPFGNNAVAGGITAPVSSGIALATLYLALMMDYQLELLGARGKVLFGGAARKNPLLCRLLAQLRGEQPVLMAGDSASTILGAWCLTRWGQSMPDGVREFEQALPADISGLLAYRDAWRQQLFPLC